MNHKQSLSCIRSFGGILNINPASYTIDSSTTHEQYHSVFSTVWNNNFIILKHDFILQINEMNPGRGCFSQPAAFLHVYVGSFA